MEKEDRKKERERGQRIASVKRVTASPSHVDNQMRGRATNETSVKKNPDASV